jgi:hypothetical protein
MFIKAMESNAFEHCTCINSNDLLPTISDVTHRLNGDDMNQIMAAIGYAMRYMDYSSTNLKTLSMPNHCIGSSGVFELCLGISKGAFPNLQDLNVHNNNIGDTGVDTLANFIVKPGLLSSLRYLNLSHNNITNFGLSQLGKSLQHGKMNKLEHVLLNGNHSIDGEGSIDFAHKCIWHLLNADVSYSWYKMNVYLRSDGVSEEAGQTIRMMQREFNMDHLPLLVKLIFYV